MIRFRIFVTVFLIFCGYNIYDVTSQRPTIYPLTKHTIVTPPRYMSLGCEGTGLEENITWSLPDNSEFWTSTNFSRRILNKDGKEEALPKFITRTKNNINITYINVTDVNDPTLVNSAALLILENVTYHDVGFYICHVEGDFIDDEDRSRRSFVFVNNDTQLSFLPTNKTYIINSRKNALNVTFPCIPTVPNVTVVLKASSSSRIADSYTEISSEIATYSSYVGYTIKISETTFDRFICEFRGNNSIEQVHFNVRFDNFYDYNMKPYINVTEDFINAKSGDELKLTCTFATDVDNTTTIDWIIPNNGSKNVINNTFAIYNEGKLHVRTLHIRYLSERDAGEYICKVRNTENNGAEAKKFVTVDLDLDDTHVKPVISTSSVHTINSGQDLILTCRSPKNISWSVPSYTETNSKVELNSENQKSMFVQHLKITNASYYDTGYYYCHEDNYENNDPNFSNQVFIYVKDKDNLNSNPTGEFKTNAAQYSNVTIQCIPTSEDVKVTLFDTSTLKERPEKYIPMTGFIIYVPVDDIIENLDCKFEKDGKTQRQKNIIDVEQTFRFEYMPFLTTSDKVYTFTGGDLVLFCSVFVRQDFFPNISWATPFQPQFLANQTLNTSETSYMVSNGKLVVNTLTINNVGLGDNREYECSILDNKNKKRYDRKVLALNIEFNIKPVIELNSDLAIGDTLTANCTVRTDHNIRFTMTWYTPADEDNRFNKTGTDVIVDVFGRIGNTTLTIKDLDFVDSGNYTCRVRDHKNNTNEETVVINIQPPQFPKIYESTLKNETVTLESGFPYEMRCKIDETDVPKPTLKWFKDYKEIDNNGSQEIGFTYTQTNDSGFYSCNVTNRLGNTSNWVHLNVKPREGLQSGITIFIGIIVFLMVAFGILIAIFGVRMLRERRFHRTLKSAGLVDFEEGQVENLNPNISISDQAELLPYNKKWEIPKDRIKIGKQLGSGQFGVVMKAEVFCVFQGETIKTVAVKMLPRHTDYQSIKALVNELKIMTYIGKHLNVVNLLGACTANIKKREIFILTEYCIHGNIRNHLLAHRDVFVNQIDPETGLIDIDNIDPSLYKKSIPSEAELAKSMNPYINMDEETPVQVRKLSQGYYKIKDLRASKREYVNLTKEDKPKYVSTHDLLCWAFQVARGMDYLSSRRILHGDLAARNVLLTDCNIVKICDFGLAKNMYKYKNYKKKTKTPLPVKWMALESIRDRIFSVQSDVWSFGVVLWEMFSMGMTPFPVMEPDAQFVKELENGLRMEQPEYATEYVYQIMMECWDETPTARPSFPILVERLGSMVHENVRQHYIELNKPYENLNIAEGAPNYDDIPDSENRPKTEKEIRTSNENGENTGQSELEIHANNVNIEVPETEDILNSKNKESISLSTEIEPVECDENDELSEEEEEEGEEEEEFKINSESDENSEDSEMTEPTKTSSESQIRNRFKSAVEVEVHPTPE